MERKVEKPEKFCPVCKNKIERTATVCNHCGTALGDEFTNLVAITNNIGSLPNPSLTFPESIVEHHLIPEDGIAIYAPGEAKVFYLNIKDEIVIGRKVEKTSDTFLDLSELDAYNLGLSRRHAMIRRTESGFELIDLYSTNGTKLNEERLVPDRPYPITNGANVHLGRLRVFVIYRTSNAS